MDSGNSGSYQSSSGGDEEYDSRAAESIFMTTHDPPPHLASISNPPPPPLFDPLSNYSVLLNPNIYWPSTTPIRSDPNPSASHDPINPVLPTPAAHNLNQTAARNPKKRSRASRRAPTTVLTTDTTNFRAMVQEFTGIPPQPFNNSSFPTTRLDLFAARSTALEPPPYLRRPFPQKVQSPTPFLVSSSSLLSSTAIDAIAAASSTANNNMMISSAFPLPVTQSSTLFNVNQNPFLTSLLQSNYPKFLFSNSSVMASRPHNQSFDHHTSSALSGLPNLISPDQIAAQSDSERWKNSNGGNPDEDEEYAAHHMKRINGGYNGGEKAPENINGGRGVGMVESWICSSD